MQISISARHGHLSPANHEIITEKVEKLSKYHDRITQVGCTVDLENRDTIRVELTVKVEHAEEFVATDTAEETLAALDGALKKIEQQLRKHKEIITNHHKPGHKSFSGESPSAS